jgi:uncharacterized protein YydD (DUF2326 family)
MPAKNKKSKKAKQPTEEQTILAKMLDTMGTQRLLQYLITDSENRISDIKKDIEDELVYAEWEGTYNIPWDDKEACSSPKQIKAYAKLLGKEIKSYKEMIKLLQKVAKIELKSEV